MRVARVWSSQPVSTDPTAPGCTGRDPEYGQMSSVGSKMLELESQPLLLVKPVHLSVDEIWKDKLPALAGGR